MEIPKAVNILMQAVPQEIDVVEVTDHLQSTDGVRGVHHVHIWNIDEHRRSLEAHVVIAREDMGRMEVIKKAIKDKLKSEFQIGHSTLEFEFPDRDDAPLGAAPPTR